MAKSQTQNQYQTQSQTPLPPAPAPAPAPVIGIRTQLGSIILTEEHRSKISAAGRDAIGLMSGCRLSIIEAAKSLEEARRWIRPGDPNEAKITALIEALS